ncbi:MAG: tetratricopeptide repeat protein, partial [Planctomycetes bacterium]|nr:tetratricopeptide repeat protein [Planctomycetota bacterium]
ARRDLLEQALAAAGAAVTAAPDEFRARLLVQDLEFELDLRGARQRYADGPAEGAAGKVLAARALLPERSHEAKALLEQALREDDELAWAHYGIAFVEHRDGHSDRAREWCERALRKDPGLVEALRLLAELCEGSDRARAIRARRLLVEISGGDLAERHALAQLLLEADDRSDATDAADELKAIIAAIGEPADAEARALARDCWLDLGTSYSRRNKPDQAIDSWRRALALDRDFLPALFNIGLVEQGRGALQAALEAFEEYLARAQASPRALPADQVLDRHFYVPNRVRTLREQLAAAAAAAEK